MLTPQEIIVHKSVENDPSTKRIIETAKVKWVHVVDNGRPETIKKTSKIISSTEPKMLPQILAGKKVLYISPAGNAVDQFEMPDDRMLCPHFDRLKLASNGCPYRCDWCYLKLTYRAAFPYITLKAEYDKIKSQLAKRLKKDSGAVIFNSGELADSLALDHLTGAGEAFIPWFAKSENGYLFMLTKSDNVDGILELEHNEHTIVAWSMNNDMISRKYEIGAPIFERRLTAAQKVQNAGYPLRIRLDPIVPFPNWKQEYAKTIQKIFEKTFPERITLGTLRFEKGFFNMRNSIFTSGSDLKSYIEKMAPMFEPKLFAGTKTPKAGKYSFSEEVRAEIFSFAIREIKKYSDCKIALCKESAKVWENVGLQASKCSCVCQLDYADMGKEASHE